MSYKYKCKQCGKPFEREWKVKPGGNAFCCHPCSVKYNRANKSVDCKFHYVKYIPENFRGDYVL